MIIIFGQKRDLQTRLPDAKKADHIAFWWRKMIPRYDS